jgi:hypothetical protein
MSYCNQVTQLAALTYDSITERASFYSTAGTDFDIIFYDNDAGLGYLMMDSFMAGIAEAIFAHCRVGIYDYTVAYLAAIIDGNVWIDDTVISHLDALSYVDAGINYTAVSNLCLISNYGEIVDVTVSANLSAVRDRRSGAYSHLLVLAVAVQQHHNLHKGIIGVLSYQKRNGCVGSLFAHDYGAGLGGSQMLFVFVVGQKADVALTCSAER